MNERYEAALKYLQQDHFSVIPVAHDTKRPLVKWKELQQRYATPDEIAHWWKQWPEANVGIITGQISDLVALDQDSDAGREQIEAHGGVPETLRSVTGKGYHYLFRHPGRRVQNFVRAMDGLDFRGDGGYIVAPPSLHASGHRYEFDCQAPIADLPEWLDEILVERVITAPLNGGPAPQIIIPSNAEHARKYALVALQNECEKAAQAPDGEKHLRRRNGAIAVAGFIPCGALDETEVYEALCNAIKGNTRDFKAAQQTIRDGIKMGMARPREIPELKKARMLRSRGTRAWIEGDKPRDELEAIADKEEEENPELKRAGSYETSTLGRTHLVVERTAKDGETTVTRPGVWDGAAFIDKEIIDEEGQTIYGIVGRTHSGRKFSIEVEAAKFADPKQMLAVLSNVAGADCVFAASMEKHLAPSIKSFTLRDELEYGRRFNRVGWHSTPDGREFLIPGRELPNTAIHLDRKLPYRIEPAAKLETGLQVLAALFRAQEVTSTTVATTVCFQAPLAVLAGWHDERYAMFIAGRTGSFKSSWTMAMMALWGPQFLSEDHVLKMGEGGTNNARMDYLARACDVPILFDNYKPNTGKGSTDLINLIHAALEGGEKDRLNRNRTQQAARAIHAWPVFTGEDFPDTDAAASARTLIVTFPYTGLANPHLTTAQSGGTHLCAVMGAWLDWLQSEDAKDVIKNAALLLNDRRTFWAGYLRQQRSDMANINRVATNLATNELTWRCMIACPALRSICSEFEPYHAQGLELLANNMAMQTAESSEANRYLEALRSMLATKRLLLMPRTQDIPEDARGRYLGWEDENGVYIVPEVAHSEANNLLRDGGGLNGMTKNAIHKQLIQVGALASMGNDGPVSVKWCGNRSQRVLHIKPEFLTENQSEEDL